MCFLEGYSAVWVVREDTYYLGESLEGKRNGATAPAMFAIAILKIS
jgi:hypothetical protein